MNSDSYVVSKERCPACARLGNDRSMDNLAVYSDGHTYCFKCGYGTRGKVFTKSAPRVTAEIGLPADVTAELPYEARAWLGQYSLGRLDIQRNNILWSPHWSRIIFPYFDETGLIAWQGRYVPCGLNKVEVNGKAPAKWFSQGKIHEILVPIKVTNHHAVLVEDIVSAIKVSHFDGAIPIFGSEISSKQFLRIKTLVDSITIWLDPDIRQKSVKLAARARTLGLETSVIFSEKDPKEHADAEIAEYLRKN